MYLKGIVMCLKAPKRTQFQSALEESVDCSPVLLSRPWRGEPNFNPTFCNYFYLPKAAYMPQGIKLMCLKAPKISKKTQRNTQKNTHFSSYFTRIRRLFLNNCKKIRTFPNFLTLTHLTPYTTKTYIKIFTCLRQFHPAQRITSHKSQVTINTKRTQFNLCT